VDFVFVQGSQMHHETGPFLEQPELVGKQRLGKGLFMGNNENHGKIAAQHGAAGIFDVAAKTKEHFGGVGYNAGSVLA
jgi:hypothetical protein